MQIQTLFRLGIMVALLSLLGSTYLVFKARDHADAVHERFEFYMQLYKSFRELTELSGDLVAGSERATLQWLKVESKIQSLLDVDAQSTSTRSDFRDSDSLEIRDDFSELQLLVRKLSRLEGGEVKRRQMPPFVRTHLRNKLSTRLKRLSEMTETMVGRLIRHQRKDNVVIGNLQQGVLALLAVLILAGVLFTELSLLKRLRMLVDAVNRVSAGDRSLRLPVGRANDEMQQAFSSFNIMIESVEEAQAKAERAAQVRRAFLANMSHEIRTPMAGILGLLDLVDQSALDAESRNYLRRIRDSGRMLKQIIDDILDLSKMESGHFRIFDESFSLRDLVEGPIELFAPIAEAKQVHLFLWLGDHLPATCIGDAARIQQILNNLISNAIKFTEQGHVVLSVASEWQDNTRVRLTFSIRDSGVGMDEETLAVIQKPFRQADSSTTRRIGGTGLGLAIVSTLLKLMGTQLNVESQPGFGSHFSFSLELPVPESPINAQFMHDQRHSILSRVLLIQSQGLERQISERMLSAFGCRVTVVETTAAASDQLEAHPESFDIVIIDHADADGPMLDFLRRTDELYRSARAKGPQRVILATASAIGRLKGLDDLQQGPSFLVKPLLPSAVFEMIVPPERRQRLEPGARDEATGELRAPDFSRTPPFRILLAEDNETNQILIREMLTRVGIHCSQVENGLEAVARVQQEHFDLVLMDLHMPIMDGEEAVRRIREQRSQQDLPVIALTAAAMPEHRRQALAAGCNEHLSKPIDAQRFYQVLKLYLDSASGRNESSQHHDVQRKKDLIERIRSDPGFDLSQSVMGERSEIVIDRLADDFLRRYAGRKDSLAGIGDEPQSLDRLVRQLFEDTQMIGAIQLNTIAKEIASGLNVEKGRIPPPSELRDQSQRLVEELRRVIRVLQTA